MDSNLGNRRHERSVIPVPITVNKHIFGTTKNVSLGGAFAVVNKRVEEMEEINIVLDLPEGKLETKGTCLRSSRMGDAQHHIALLFQIEFEDDAVIERLQRFIDSAEGIIQ